MTERKVFDDPATVEEKAQAVAWFQSATDHDRMRCGNLATHPPLAYDIHRDLLFCTRCTYTQPYVPKEVIRAWRAQKRWQIVEDGPDPASAAPEHDVADFSPKADE